MSPRRGSGRFALLVAGFVVACIVLMGTVLLSLAVGNKGLPLPDVWTALITPGADYADAVVQSRVQRTVLGVLVGASLAVAGVVMQGITRNPLADPGLLGVNVGAAASIVTAAAVFGLSDSTSNPWIAIPGSCLAVIAVYLLGSSRRGATPVRLVLAGVVVGAVLTAYIQGVTLSLPDVFDSYRYWVVGSLAGRNPAVVWQILPFIVVGLLLALALGRSLNVLALGEETAQALGAQTGRTRIAGAVSVTLLCAAATSAVGPVSFVGLAVPHIVRGITGDDHRWLMPYCLVLGPALLLVSDVIGRVIVRPQELMVGVVTAFVGAPFLFVAVRRMRGRA